MCPHVTVLVSRVDIKIFIVSTRCLHMDDTINSRMVRDDPLRSVGDDGPLNT